MTGNKVHGTKRCGARTKKSGSPCQRPAGWGTDHTGSGRCKLHGGRSTGAKTPEGKAKVSQNAVKHGAYIDKILNDEERMIYDWLTAETSEKYELNLSDPTHALPLHRAAMSYLKLMRLDEWEMTEEYEAINIDLKKDPETGKEELVGSNVYDKDGNIIGQEKVRLRRLRWSKNIPAWEQHFQNYFKLLAIDRASIKKKENDQDLGGKMIDAFSWLWGRSDES